MRALLPLAVLLLTGCGDGVRKHFFVKTDDGAHLKVLLEGNLDSDVVLLLLHGGPVGSASAYNTGSAAAELESSFAVAYLDQRGQGGSQGGIDTDAYGLQRAGQDVETVVDVLRGRFGQDTDLYLYGHSWGGMLGTLTLLDTDAGDDVTGWIETAGCHDSVQEPHYVISRLEDIGGAERDAGNNTADWDEILEFTGGFDDVEPTFDSSDLYTLNQYGYRAENLIDAITWEDPTLADALSVVTRPERSAIQAFAGSASLDTLYAEAETASYTARLDEIPVPGLYLYAKYDFVCPPQLGEDALDANPNDASRGVVLEQSGHSLMAQEPEAFVDAIRTFVEDTRGQR